MYNIIIHGYKTNFMIYLCLIHFKATEEKAIKIKSVQTKYIS